MFVFAGKPQSCFAAVVFMTHHALNDVIAVATVVFGGVTSIAC